MQDGIIFNLSVNQLSKKDQSFIEAELRSGKLSKEGYTGNQSKPVKPVLKNKLHFNASKRIDAIIRNYWNQSSITGGAIVNDEVYLRRAYLRIIGRIPTSAEAIHFLNNSAVNKRSQLVDKLLDSTGYVSHQYHLWADVLRVNTVDLEHTQGGIYYAPWIKEQIRNNVPYDKFVRSLITAKGQPWDNPAVGYYLRDEDMPFDNMAMGLQVFLGTHMQCAQCHDDPSGEWSQKDFLQLAAYSHPVATTGVRIATEIGDKSELQFVRNVFHAYKKEREESEHTENLYRMYRRWMRFILNGVSYKDGDLSFPDDYAYPNARPGARVIPKFPFADNTKANPSSAEGKIKLYADWITSRDNERFTRIIVNRMWKFAMGQAITEPVDKFTSIDAAPSPELLAFLETVMRHLDYDLKQFLRILYNTEFFQLKSVVASSDDQKKNQLKGPLFERMSAEQLWDSLATLMRPDIDNDPEKIYKGRYFYTTLDSSAPLSISEYVKNNPAREFIKVLAKQAEYYNQYHTHSLHYEKIKRSGSSTSAELNAAKEAFVASKKYWLSLNNPVMSKPKSDVEKISTPQNIQIKGAMRQIELQMVRASELNSPQANGHLLEVFGQSDRLTIENSTKKSNLLQALFLMNSQETNEFMVEHSQPVIESMAANSPEEQLEIIFLGFLARKPSPEEFDLLIDDFRIDPFGSKSKFIWAMLNTNQFRFIQ
jgi:hypothetical protein